MFVSSSRTCQFYSLITRKHFSEQCHVDKLYTVVDKVAQNNELKCRIWFLAV